MPQRLTHRGDTTQNWTRTNPVLAGNEVVYDSDQEDFKVGDGVRTFNELPYLLAPFVALRALRDIYDVPDAVRQAVAAGTFVDGEMANMSPALVAASRPPMTFNTRRYRYVYERGYSGLLTWVATLKRTN